LAEGASDWQKELQGKSHYLVLVKIWGLNSPFPVSALSIAQDFMEKMSHPPGKQSFYRKE
jgi:hypothetical protein